MTRPAKIRQIIQSREPIRRQAQDAHTRLVELGQRLSEFRAYLPGFFSHASLSANLKSLLPTLDSDLSAIIDDIVREQVNLNRLVSRFSRKTINIGVAGFAGMGKSTLLQKITGLDNSAIPAGQAGGHHYTGAPSMIFNVEATQPFADIELHSENSFIQDYVAPYFPALQAARALPTAIPIPKTINDFRHADLLQDPPPNANATGIEQLNKLRSIQSKLSVFEDKLTGGTIRVYGKEIAQYVAQRDPDDPDQQLFLWHAVRMARISSPFPTNGVGDIAVADTPGLGDFVCDAERHLSRTVGENLDIVVFVRRPWLLGDRYASISQDDVRLYEIMGHAIPDLPLSEWSFFLLNRDSQSGLQCNGYQAALEAPSSSVRVRAVHQVDCTDASKVSEFLDAILDDMVNNMALIDKKLMSKRKEEFDRIAIRIREFRNKAYHDIGLEVNGGIGNANPGFQIFLEKFDEAWGKLSSGLRSLENDESENRFDDDTEFINKLDVITESMDIRAHDELLPSAAELAVMAKADPGKIQSVFEQQRSFARVRLSSEFLKLNDALHRSMRDLKSRVWEHLKAKDGGNFGSLFPNHNSTDDPGEWLCRFRDLLAANGAHLLASAFTNFAQFELEYRGFIQHRVRSNLDYLTPNTDKAAQFDIPSQNATPDIAREKLVEAFETALVSISAELRLFAAEPNEARFAILEEFVDSALTAQRTKMEWQSFYYAMRDIWPEFKDIAVLERAKNDFRIKIDAIVSML